MITAPYPIDNEWHLSPGCPWYEPLVGHFYLHVGFSFHLYGLCLLLYGLLFKRKFFLCVCNLSLKSLPPCWITFKKKQKERVHGTVGLFLDETSTKYTVALVSTRDWSHPSTRECCPTSELHVSMGTTCAHLYSVQFPGSSSHGII